MMQNNFMSTEKLNTEELFVSLANTTYELLELISSVDEKSINSVPFKDSWTAAQLASHVTKSNNSIVQALNTPGKPAERNPGEGVQELKAMFLDFNTKLKSPEFILPTRNTYQKETLIANLKKSMEQVKDTGNKMNLSDIIRVPVFGEITKLELLHFVLYHTQRHIHQLKKILHSVEDK